MSFVAGIADSTVSLATPLLLAALGEVIAERSGVINLGVEGMMLAGALAGFAAAVVTNSMWLGVLVGLLAGVSLALVHAVLAVSLNADQVVSGIMITILGIGLTTLLGRSWVGQSVSGFEEIAVPGLSRLPIVGQAMFNVTALDYLALALTPIVWYFLTRTNIGAEITAVGEDPEAADTAGVPVFRIRYGCILIGGALAGIAGAQLSVAFTNFWTSEMIAGRGWIAVALVIFGQWRVGSVFLGAYLFAAVDALSFRSGDVGLGSEVFGSRLIADVVDVALDPQVMQVYPYLATVVALWYIMRRGTLEELGAPNSLVETYSRERD